MGVTADGGTLRFNGPDHEKSWNEGPQPEKAVVENLGHQEPCERSPEKPPDHARAKVDQRRN